MGDVTTFCSLWRLTLKDGSTLGLTDHDVVIVREGQSYTPIHAAEAGQAEARAGLSVDSGGVQTLLTLPGFSQQAVLDGALDQAVLEHFRHDWRTGETVTLAKGVIGDVSLTESGLSVEWLGQSSRLRGSTGRVFSRQCDASFGDARCGLDANAFPDGTTCPRSFEACGTQFGNTVNFRGFPYLLGDDVLQAGVRETDRRDGGSRFR